MRALYNERAAMEEKAREGSVERFTEDGVDGVVFYDKQNVTVKGFSGKRSKPDFFYRYNSWTEASDKIARYFQTLKAIAEAKETRKKERAREREKAKTYWNVGDIVVNSWGYEQTNIDFYEVIEKKGATLTLREIAGESVEGSGERHGMADRVRPVPGAFIEGEEPFRKRITGKHLSFEYGGGSKHEDGGTYYRSWYA